MNPIREALYSYLDGNQALAAMVNGIHHARAPQDAISPYVLFERAAGLPVYPFGRASAAMEDERWLVEAVHVTDSANTAENVAAVLDRLLQDAPIQPPGYGVLWFRRASAVDYRVRDGADQFQHVGAIYRVVTERRGL